MRNTVHNKVKTGLHEWLYEVDIISENSVEANAIKAFATLNATPEQDLLVANFINFNLKLGVPEYSAISMENKSIQESSSQVRLRVHLKVAVV